MRVFNATAPLTLIGFTVNNGKAPTNQLGGGIITNKALTLTAMTISNNQASSGGGVYLDSGGSALITDSTLKGNSAVNAGGALFDQGDSVTIQRSSIYSNTAADGGGILVDSGTLLVVNSTVSGNQATGSTPSGRGGGVWVAITSATVRYSSMLNNSASNTGGGLFVKAGGDVALDSTVIAASPTGGDCIGTVSGPGHNFIEDGVNTCGLTFGVNNNIVGQSPSGLAPLGDYGGPTWTHAGYYSGNIPDHGNPATCPAVDQRGFARPRG